MDWKRKDFVFKSDENFCKLYAQASACARYSDQESTSEKYDFPDDEELDAQEYSIEETSASEEYDFPDDEELDAQEYRIEGTSASEEYDFPDDDELDAREYNSAETSASEEYGFPDDEEIDNQEYVNKKLCDDLMKSEEIDKLSFPDVMKKEMREQWNKTVVLEDGKSFNTYEFSKKILSEYEIWHLAEGDSLLWIFNGKVYEPLSTQRLQALIYQNIPEYVKVTLKSCEKIKKDVASYIMDECTDTIIPSGAARRYAKTFSLNDTHEIYGKVVLENGIYDVLKDAMLPFDSSKPYYYMLNARFLYNMPDNELKTPFFDKLISDATGGDEDSMRMICYSLGMLLLPNKCKKFIVAGNASNAGKSVLFGKFLDRVFDPKRISRVDTDKLGGRFALGSIADKLLISCLDINDGIISPSAAGMIKRVTGEERITTEEKYQAQGETVVRFKFIFGTNSGFSTRKYDRGLANRIIVLPFIKETPERQQIPDLLDRLCEEKDKIITKILRLMKEVIKDDGSIDIPESSLSVRLKNEWTTFTTFFSEFCEEAISVTGNKEDFVTKEKLYEAYQLFFLKKSSTRRNGQRYEIMTMHNFIINIKSLYPDKIREGRSRNYGNVTFKNPVRRLEGIKILE